MPEDKRTALSAYRLSRAQESLEAAQDMIAHGHYLDSINRSYYAIFHSLRAVLALDGVDFKKHSGVIAHFQKEYVKTEIFDTTISKHITSAFQIRNESDYEDFFLASKSEATEQLENARGIFAVINVYIKSKTEGADNSL